MHQERLYKAQEFAERAGVTVRTLLGYIAGMDGRR